MNFSAIDTKKFYAFWSSYVSQYLYLYKHSVLIYIFIRIMLLYDQEQVFLFTRILGIVGIYHTMKLIKVKVDNFKTIYSRLDKFPSNAFSNHTTFVLPYLYNV